MTKFSDYIVYVDESGDPNLTSVNSDFPVFALVFCLISKNDYTERIVPDVQKFKFCYWGHDMTILHEHAIRKEKDDFTFLMTHSNLRKEFLDDLNRIINNSPIQIITSIINKKELCKRYSHPYNPYELALLFCLERLFDFLISNGQEGKQIHVIFERRGKKEDSSLELEFRRICDRNEYLYHSAYQRRDFTRIKFEPCFVPKSINSTGLQLADLMAHPIAIKTIRPNQNNRAFDIIQPKLWEGKIKVFP